MAISARRWFELLAACMNAWPAVDPGTHTCHSSVRPCLWASPPADSCGAAASSSSTARATWRSHSGAPGDTCSAITASAAAAPGLDRDVAGAARGGARGAQCSGGPGSDCSLQCFRTSQASGTARAGQGTGVRFGHAGPQGYTLLCERTGPSDAGQPALHHSCGGHAPPITLQHTNTVRIARSRMAAHRCAGSLQRSSGQRAQRRAPPPSRHCPAAETPPLLPLAGALLSRLRTAATCGRRATLPNAGSDRTGTQAAVLTGKESLCQIATTLRGIRSGTSHHHAVSLRATVELHGQC